MTEEANTSPLNGSTASAAIAPGELLRQARERAGLSQEDIAGKLKLAARQIAAIESGDLASLPERTFTRGFMRSYARLVGVDPTALGLDQPAAQATAPTEFRQATEVKGEVTFDPSGKSRSAARWAVPVLLVAALAAGVVYFQGGHLSSMLPVKLGGGPQAPSLKTAVAAQAEQAEAAKQAAATPQAGAVGSVITAPPATSPTPTATDAPASTPATATAPANSPATSTEPSVITPPAPAASPAATPAAAPVATAPAPQAGEKRISLTFKGKSWTEVRSKGEVIFSENAQPGTREFNGAPPLSFAVGNASNVTLMIDGKPFDITNQTRNDVARFRVE